MHISSKEIIISAGMLITVLINQAQSIIDQLNKSVIYILLRIKFRSQVTSPLKCFFKWNIAKQICQILKKISLHDLADGSIVLIACGLSFIDEVFKVFKRASIYISPLAIKTGAGHCILIIG